MQAKGGSFAKDKDFYRFTLGRGEVIPAFEEAITSMKEGGIRRIVVPVELGYPNNDMNALGPSPTTFSVSTAPCSSLLSSIHSLVSIGTSSLASQGKAVLVLWVAVGQSTIHACVGKLERLVAGLVFLAPD